MSGRQTSTSSIGARGRRPTRDREFAIGRKWWVMPIAYLIGQFIAFLVIERTTSFSGDSPWDWVLFVSLMIGSPTLAAILLSPGFSRYHFAVATGAVLIGGVIFSLQSNGVFELFVVSTIVTAIQVFVLRMTRVPPWVIRPVRSGRDQKASIGWLLMMTVIAAVLIAIIRVAEDGGQYLVVLAYLGLAMMSALVGNTIAGLRSGKVRWLIVVVVGALGWASMVAAESGVLSLENWKNLVEIDFDYASKIVCLAPAASLIIVVLVHRMMALRIGNVGTRKVRPVGAGTSEPPV
ncbi:hypothetical protein FHS27_004195 [Rhodopirellula rubra]|uniref:Uncharacterized protein n=1 Tax=Aporhodopirellula rubra TaxID=980271 RepID=A0A7W5E300_9BACT|nr:hypothetical protein [Aporhodopirellula rubra]MBB3208367.1 hypothetical protein [Aporhodopirellula rubra]